MLTIIGFLAVVTGGLSGAAYFGKFQCDESFDLGLVKLDVEMSQEKPLHVGLSRS